MSKRYEEFLSEIMPYARDCPELVAINAARNAAIEFCDQTHILLHELDSFASVANQYDYDIDVPAQTEIARVVELTYLDDTLLPASNENFTVGITQTGSPGYFTHLEPNIIRVAPVPQSSETEAFKGLVALRPTRSSSAVDDVLYNRWCEGIAAGALMRLTSMVGQPFFDMALSAAHRARFVSAVGTARIERNRGLTRQSPRVVFPGF